MYPSIIAFSKAGFKIADTQVVKVDLSVKVEKSGRKTTFLDDEYFSFAQN